MGHDIAVDVSTVKAPSTTQCGIVRGVVHPGDIKYVRCAAGSEGRYVTVTTSGFYEMLSLHELQVYGEGGRLTPCLFRIFCNGDWYMALHVL